MFYKIIYAKLSCRRHHIKQVMGDARHFFFGYFAGANV